MRKPKKPTMTITVRVEPDISQALDNWADENGKYVRAAFEELVEAGLQANGPSVAKEAKRLT